MVRLALLLPVTLAACVAPAATPPSPAGIVQDRAAQVAPIALPDLRGRWTVTVVNGRSEAGLWLELGGEGLATITQEGNAIYVRTPDPPTQAYLGCNWWRPSGWTRQGDKLALGTEASTRTERGCDPHVEALDDQVYAILRNTMTIEFDAPNRLRLANEVGTLELIRNGYETE